jgi:soluble lytic murein transglycosylase-like protein
MTEIAYSPPPAWSPLRALQLAGLAVGTALVTAGLVMLRPARTVPRLSDVQAPTHRFFPAIPPHPRVSASPRTLPAAPAPSAFAPLGRPAALAFDRGLFTASPGGVFATAARVAGWRRLVVDTARRHHVDPNLLEAIVFVESSGRPAAMAAGDPAAASGLTQLTASTAIRVLHLPVHLHASRLLTRRIWLASVRGEVGRARTLEARRRVADPRFSPLRALDATARFLTVARGELGREDLAVAAYHLGVANVRGLLRRFGSANASYAELYFGSAPDRHASAWRRLHAIGPDGADYYWKVLAAERLMRLWRHDRPALAFEDRQQLHKNSAEEVLHPLASTYRFSSPRALARAWRHHRLRGIPRDARATHVVVSGTLGQMAQRLGRSPRLYRGLRPDALAALLYIGERVHELSGARRPLIVTSAVRDLRYQRVLLRHNAMAARSYSLHTTGYAFDIARVYGSAREAAAFEFVLDRLVALHLIAYIREPEAIHVAVASGAGARLRALRGDL